MKKFTEWLSEAYQAKFGTKQYGPYSWEDTTPNRTAFYEAIHDVVQGMHNSLANATPGQGIRIDFTYYLNILNDASKDGYGKQFTQGLEAAHQAIQAAARKFVEALRGGHDRLTPGFQQAMEPVWIQWMRAREILMDILQKRDKSHWYVPARGKL